MKIFRNYIIVALTFAILVSLTLIGLFWISAGIVLFILSLALIIALNRLFSSRYFRIGVCNPLLISLFFIFHICLRLFIFEIFTVPSRSMEDTILLGDKILVSKIHYGPRMPGSIMEIPWIKIIDYFDRNNQVQNISKWIYKRLKGFTEVRNGDIVVFNHPGKADKYFIKRCIGLPGDLLEIKNGIVFVNNKPFQKINTVKHFYWVLMKSQKDLNQILECLEISPGWEWSERSNRGMQFKLNHDQTDRLIKSGITESIKRYIVDTINMNKRYVWNEKLKWTIDNFGPIEVPYKCMAIEFDTCNYLKYNWITYPQNVSNPHTVGDFFKDQESSNKYVIKQDYYFMIGDDRHNSIDSRYWGFVSEDKIVGKAILVLFSNSYDGVKWKRTFKILY